MIQHRWIEAFTLTLVHSLWQGMILGILAAFVLMLTKKASASLRYNLINLLVPCFLAGCVVTFLVELRAAPPVVIDSPENTSANGIHNLLKGLGWRIPVKNVIVFVTANSNWIAMVWLICFAYQCIRIFIGLNYINRLKLTGRALSEHHWQQRVDIFCSLVKIKKTVGLFESALTKIPVVVGFLKPVIYVPAGMINHLPPDQVEAILLHELAHIRRNDYLAGLLQQIALAVFFFNPGLRWVIAILKREREHCCDDIALVNTQNKTALVEALLNFAKLSLNTPVHVAAFPGSGRLLLHRVKRIALNRNQSLDIWERLAFGISMVAGLFLAGISAAVQKPAVPSQPATYYSSASVPAVGLHAPVAANDEAKVSAIAVRQPATILPVTAKKKPVLSKAKPVEKRPSSFETALYADASPASKKEIVPFNIAPEDAVAMDREQAERNRKQAEIDRKQADADRIQADADRKQADADRRQAELGRQQADRDRQQADRDRLQAEKDRMQADIDRAHAEQDRQKANRGEPKSH